MGAASKKEQPSASFMWIVAGQRLRVSDSNPSAHSGKIERRLAPFFARSLHAELNRQHSPAVQSGRKAAGPQ
jgi:hypothetical protein